MQSLGVSSRRGTSMLISALLIMVISTSLAIGIGYAVTQTLRISFAPALTCAQLQINTPFVIDSATLDADGRLATTITHKSNSASPDAIILRMASSEGVTIDWVCGAQCGGCTLPAKGETKKYVFDESSTSISELAILTEGCVITSKEVS